MSCSAAKKPAGAARVIFLADAKSRKGGTPRPVTDSEVVTYSTDIGPVITCGIDDNMTDGGMDPFELNDAKARLKQDLTQFAEGLLSKQALSQRWPSGFYSWKAMRYNRTGGKGKYKRHPAFDTFPGFLSVLGPKPAPDWTLDRVDHNNPEYSPENCRWASKALQTANRRNTRILTDSHGYSYSVAEWSRKTGISQSTIRHRIDAGKTVDETMHTAVGGFSRDAARKSDSASTRQFITIWRQILKDSYGQPFFSPTGKDIGLLQSMEKVFVNGNAWPTKALEYVLTNWSGFVGYAEHHYGAWQKAPTVPTVGYLSANIQAAGNFYLNEKAEHEPDTEAKGWFEIASPVEPKPEPDNSVELLASLEHYDY